MEYIWCKPSTSLTYYNNYLHLIKYFWIKKCEQKDYLMETDNLWYIKIALCLLFLLLSFLLVHDNFPYYFIQALFSTFIEGKIPTVKITGHQYLNIFLFSFIKYVQHSLNLGWQSTHLQFLMYINHSLLTDVSIRIYQVLTKDQKIKMLSKLQKFITMIWDQISSFLLSLTPMGLPNLYSFTQNKTAISMLKMTVWAMRRRKKKRCKKVPVTWIRKTANAQTFLEILHYSE